MEWLFGGISIRIEQGPYDDKNLGLAMQSKDIPFGLASGGVGFTATETSSAKNTEYWPPISIRDLDRRQRLFDAACSLLESASRLEEKEIGFFTAGLDVLGVPSWEIAEEIIRALHKCSKEDTCIEKVVIVAGTPTQLSSFQYALDNVSVIV
ncbi:MAG: hypothetical protein ACTSUB_01505 [Candidatus Thorarchaeota archaeon]